MKRAYLVLAIVGAVVPYVFFTQFLLSGQSLAVFMPQLFATPPAAGIISDLLISSLVFWIWSFREARLLEMSRWWAYVVVNLTIGLSCALPLFLYVREQRAASAGTSAPS